MKLLGRSLCMLLCAVAGAGRAQEAVRETPLPPEAADKALGAQLVFAFVPKAPGQPSWEIKVAADHSGSYRELAENAVSQPLHVSDVVWKRLQAGTKAVHSGRCETKTKGIAQTGEKTFSIVMGPSLTSCKFNFSDDDALNEAASAFLALAETLHEGAKLQHDHKFDKLALDADMDLLLDEVEVGRVLEPGNIAPVLQSLVDDDHVIDRVRRKAARLLQVAGDKPR